MSLATVEVAALMEFHDGFQPVAAIGFLVTAAANAVNAGARAIQSAIHLEVRLPVEDGYARTGHVCFANSPFLFVLYIKRMLLKAGPLIYQWKVQLLHSFIKCLWNYW